MFLLRAILLSVGHHISLLWVRTGSEPDFNTKQLTTSWREWTINIFSRITIPTSEGVCLFSNSLFESTHLQKSADEDHVIWKLVFISTVSKLNDELWSSVSQNLLVIVLGIWWGERVITPTMQLQGCVGFFMVCCDAKKQKKQKKPSSSSFFYCRVPAVSRLSSRQEVISLHTLGPPVLLNQDTAATTHVRSALNFAASAHRCKTLTGCWIWITREMASTDVPLSHREGSALWLSVCCVVMPKRQTLTKLVPRFACQELYRVLPPQSCITKAGPKQNFMTFTMTGECKYATFG